VKRGYIFQVGRDEQRGHIARDHGMKPRAERREVSVESAEDEHGLRVKLGDLLPEADERLIGSLRVTLRPPERDEGDGLAARLRVAQDVSLAAQRA
jgi:hypothetical protein